MSEEIVEPDDVWRRINWPGIIAGTLLIALPFLGRWWIFKLGTEAFTMVVSPFGVELRIFGETMIVSPLVWWLILGLKLGVGVGALPPITVTVLAPPTDIASTPEADTLPVIV